MPQPRVKLVVTGDDFGYCRRRNQGIVECFWAGAVSNVSLLVNGYAARDAAELAKRHRIPIGLHANLSEGLPVCEELRKNSSLLNKEGFFHGKMGFRTALRRGLIKMSEVERELRAQVKLFSELTGHLPLHMDGHQHVHVLPEVCHVFARVLSEYKIKYTRVPIEPGLRDCSWLEKHLKDFYLDVEQDSLSSLEVFARRGIRWPDVYIGLTTMGKNMSVSNIQTAIEHAILSARTNQNSANKPCRWLSPTLNCGSRQDATLIVELMVHPGYPSMPQEGGCGEGPDDFSQSSDRLHELLTLKDPELLTFYKKRNIELCSFRADLL
uniref:Carbohydrate deacetylase n=1 Tax=Latimeria chalumnae TaxID=7897 RepID=H3AXC0_LATCH